MLSSRVIFFVLTCPKIDNVPRCSYGFTSLLPVDVLGLQKQRQTRLCNYHYERDLIKTSFSGEDSEEKKIVWALRITAAMPGKEVHHFDLGISCVPIYCYDKLLNILISKTSYALGVEIFRIRKKRYNCFKLISMVVWLKGNALNTLIVVFHIHKNRKTVL